MFSAKLDSIKREFDKYSKKMILNLKEKYNQDFEIIGSIGDTLGAGGDRWRVKPINAYDDYSFTVFGSHCDTGYKFSDSYYSVLIQNDYEKLISDILLSEFDSFKLFVDISTNIPNPPALNSDVAVENIWRYLENGEYLFVSKITVLLPFYEQYSISKKLYNISQKISKLKLSAWIEAYTLSQEAYKSVRLSINDYTDFEAFLDNIAEVFCIDRSYNVIHKNCGRSTDKLNREYMTEEKLIKLCSAVYLNGIINNKYMGSLGEILEYIKFTEYADSMINGHYPCEMSKEQWDTMVDGIIQDRDLYSLKLIKSIDVNEHNWQSYPDFLPGHRAVCFLDDFKTAYVVFRGTCGDHEWYDNAAGMVLESTNQQQAAANFINEIRNDKLLNIKQLIAAGHSKGGNKALYAAITTSAGYVNKCIVFDGQGFSKNFINRYETNIKERADIISLFAEQRDFVNCLGFYTGKTTFYRGWRGSVSESLPYGYPMPYFHCPDALGNEYGLFGESFLEGSIPKTLNKLVTFMLDGSKYAKNPYEIAVDIIALLMKNKKSTLEQTAEACKNLIMVFLELTSASEEFRDDITELVYTETNVILSTIGFAVQNTTDCGNKASSKTLSSLIISKLSDEIFSSLTSLHYLAESLDFFVKLINNLITDAGVNRLRLIDYILGFIGNLLTKMSAGTDNKYIWDCLFSWADLQMCFNKQFFSHLIKEPLLNNTDMEYDKNISDVLSGLEKNISVWRSYFEK